jgi:hypothetical protein
MSLPRLKLLPIPCFSMFPAICVKGGFDVDKPLQLRLVRNDIEFTFVTASGQSTHLHISPDKEAAEFVPLGH